MAIGPEERDAFREMARSFAKRTVAPILEHESADGDVSKIPDIVKTAKETGLLALPDPESPGFETGIWGRHALEEGPEVSLMLLEELGVACGGVAMNLHAAGLASLCIGMAGNLPEPLTSMPAIALFEGGFPMGPAVMESPDRDAPAKIMTQASKKGGSFVVHGKKEFVHQCHGTDSYIVFAREGKDWLALLIPSDTDGIEVKEIERRMGLRAGGCVDLDIKDAEVQASSALDFPNGTPTAVMTLVSYWWLGSVAIAAGMARGALLSARAYAHERYQGTTEIINHPGMRSLLSDSSARIMAARGVLAEAVKEAGRPEKLLLAAAKAKLHGMNETAAAVTDSLQLFGGYGYMEDYGMEKRYRDINTLKSVGGGPRDIRAAIAELEMEE